MKARLTGANDRAVRNPDRLHPLSANQARLARAMADVLIDATKRTGAPFHQGDLVIKRYVSSSGHSDLLCILGDKDAITSIIDFARSLGSDEASWTEGSDGQARSSAQPHPAR